MIRNWKDRKERAIRCVRERSHRHKLRAAFLSPEGSEKLAVGRRPPGSSYLGFSTQKGSQKRVVTLRLCDPIRVEIMVGTSDPVV
jgi:hypothetical protein